MNINNAATTDYFSPHSPCFTSPSSQSQKGCCGGRKSPHEKVDQGLCPAVPCFGPSLCCSSTFSPLASLCMPRTSLLLALSTLFLFTEFVYSTAMYLTFQFSPCLGPGIALTLVKTLSAVVEKNIISLCIEEGITILPLEARSPAISLVVMSHCSCWDGDKPDKAPLILTLVQRLLTKAQPGTSSEASAA